MVLPPIAWPTTDAVRHLVTLWETNPSNYVGSGLLPLNEQDYRENPDFVAWDEVQAIRGKTNAHYVGNDAVRVELPGAVERIERTAYWKEQITFEEDDLIRLGGLGETRRNRLAGRMVMKAQATLRTRLATLRECLIWDCMRGQIVINQNGVQRTVDYNVTAASNVPVSWATTGLADPIKDIQDEVLFFRATGGSNPMVYITQAVANLMSQNQSVRTLISGSGFVGQIGNQQITQLLPQLVGGIAGIIIYDEHYTDDAGLSSPFLLDTQMILVAQGPAGERMGEFASTPNLHNGGIDGAQGGEFLFLDEQINKSRPYVNVVAGLYGIPILFHPEWVRVKNVVF